MPYHFTRPHCGLSYHLIHHFAGLLDTDYLKFGHAWRSKSVQNLLLNVAQIDSIKILIICVMISILVISRISGNRLLKKLLDVDMCHMHVFFYIRSDIRIRKWFCRINWYMVKKKHIKPNPKGDKKYISTSLCLGSRRELGSAWTRSECTYQTVECFDTFTEEWKR